MMLLEIFYNISHTTEVNMAVLPLLAVAGLTSAGGAILNGLSKYIGSKSASSERKKNEELNKAEYNRAKNERAAAGNTLLDTASGKAIMSEANQQLESNNRANNNSSIKTGATDAQKLAQAQSSNRTYANIASNLTQQSEAYKERMDNKLDAARANYLTNVMNNNEANAQSKQNGWNGIGDAIGGAAQAAGQIYAMNSMMKTAPAAETGAATPKGQTKSFTSNANAPINQSVEKIKAAGEKGLKDFKEGLNTSNLAKMKKPLVSTPKMTRQTNTWASNIDLLNRL